MNQVRQFSPRGLAALLVLVATGVAAAALLREDERVEELMERIHEGRRSPHRQLRAQAVAPQPAWPLVAATLPAFERMSAALLDSPVADIQDSADGYVDAVRGLVAATRARDPRALRESFEALEQSCGDCHFDGGVGGELEHEEEEEDEHEDDEDEDEEEDDEDEDDEDEA